MPDAEFPFAPICRIGRFLRDPEAQQDHVSRDLFAIDVDVAAAYVLHKHLPINFNVATVEFDRYHPLRREQFDELCNLLDVAASNFNADCLQNVTDQQWIDMLRLLNGIVESLPPVPKPGSLERTS